MTLVEKNSLPHSIPIRRSTRARYPNTKCRTTPPEMAGEAQKAAAFRILRALRTPSSTVNVQTTQYPTTRMLQALHIQSRTPTSFRRPANIQHLSPTFQTLHIQPNLYWRRGNLQGTATLTFRALQLKFHSPAMFLLL